MFFKYDLVITVQNIWFTLILKHTLNCSFNNTFLMLKITFWLILSCAYAVITKKLYSIIVDNMEELILIDNNLILI